ncbi:MAG: hypothetical protein JXQ73_09745 [Phycisphaerae bacterium]|nr:hypothetical protein [Phycisphaerae bacterium]
MQPTNQARLVGSVSLDLVGDYPKEIVFNGGAYAQRGDRGVVILTGPSGDLLFNYKGPQNRFELLLTNGSESILYRRLGQLPLMIADGQDIPRPVGVDVGSEGDRLEGSFDVMVERADPADYGSRFEHYPVHIRVTGTFSVPPYREPVGPATRPTTFPSSLPVGSGCEAAGGEGCGLEHGPR